MVGLVPPPPSCVLLNTDGSFNLVGNQAGRGGVLRDHRGSLLCGFSVRKDVSSAVVAELWGLFHGLMLAWDLGFHNLSIQIYSSIFLKWIIRRCSRWNKHFSLVSECKELLGR